MTTLASCKKNLGKSAAHLTFVGLKKAFPAAKLLCVECDDLGFSLTVDLPFAFQKEFFTLVEESVRFLIKEGLQIIEMVPISARGYFERYAPQLLEELKCLDASTVCIYQTPQRELLHVTDSHLEDALELYGHIKLLDFDYLDGQLMIFGIYAENAQLLKERQKFLKHAYRCSHTNDAKQLYEKSASGIFWTPQGEKIFQKVIKFLREQYEQMGFKAVRTPLENNLCKTHLRHIKLFNAKMPIRIYEMQPMHKDISKMVHSGLFALTDYLHDRAHCFVKEDQILNEIISLLQFIQETFKILSLKTSCCYRHKKESDIFWLKQALTTCQISFVEKGSAISHKGPRIEFFAKDAFDRPWVLSWLEVYPFEHGFIISMSLASCVERLLGLLIETKKLETIEKEA